MGDIANTEYFCGNIYVDHWDGQIKDEYRQIRGTFVRGGRGLKMALNWTYEIMNCLKYNFAMHTFFDIEKINVYLIRGTFGGRRWKHGFERKKS